MIRCLFFILLLPSFLYAAPKQSVLLITIDTLRADHLGCYGDRTASTPKLDALARKSLFFADAVTQVPLTLPAHTSLMTGLYPYHHGVRDNAGSVDQKTTTLAEILRRNGYHTYAFVGGFPLDHRFGLNQGFDVYDDVFEREKNASLDFRSERSADAVVRSVLSKKIKAPYFVWIHFYDPHAPYLHGGYDGEISFVDQQIGNLLPAFPNTLIAVAGDHGESLGEHGEWTHRIFLYDATMHVPFFLYRPGLPASRVQKQVRLIDFLPTLLSILQIPAPAGVDGAVLPKGAGTPSYMETYFPQLELGWSPLTAVRTDQWKYIQAPSPELYSLANDPKETKNLYKAKPEIAKKLQAQLPHAGMRNPQSAVSAEMQEQLASLGYVSGNRGSKEDSNIDPKDRIQIWNQIEMAVDLEKTKPEESLAILQKAQKTDPENPMLLSFLAQKYAETNRLEEAKQVLQKIIQTSPRNPLALYRLALVALKSNNPSEAVRWAETLRAMEPENADALILLARAKIKLGNFTEAAGHLEAALQIDPGDVGLRSDLGNLYLQMERTQEARTQFQLVLKSNPENLQALNGMARAFYAEHDLARSEAILKQALAVDALDPQTKINLALVYATQGKRTEAIELYRQVADSPSTPPDWKAEAQSRLEELQ